MEFTRFNPLSPIREKKISALTFYVSAKVGIDMEWNQR